MDNQELLKRIEVLEEKIKAFQSVAQLDPQIIRTVLEIFKLANLADLKDVSDIAPSNGQVLKYVSSTGLWTPGTDNTGA